MKDDGSVSVEIYSILCRLTDKEQFNFQLGHSINKTSFHTSVNGSHATHEVLSMP